MSTQQTQQKQPAQQQQSNEGEGSRSAARNYDKATEQYVKSGKVDAAAKEAKRAVEGTERAELERAEEEGKKHRADK